MNKMLKPIKYTIKKYINDVIKELNPKCIILYGSLARGDFNERSDIDIIVISSLLPKNYYERAKLLYGLIKTFDPIDPIGFTPEEFINMIKKRHCTSLFAMEEGKALYGKKYFSYLKKIHKEVIIKYKIVKGNSARIPKALI